MTPRHFYGYFLNVMPNQAEINKTANLIKGTRELAGLTQEEAAKVIGYSVSMLQKFEGGRRTPPARSLAPMIAALNKAAK